MSTPPPDHLSNTRLGDLTTQYLRALKPRKFSAHTTAAYVSDLNAISALLANAAGVTDLGVEHLTGRLLRAAFADFADTHATASIARAWSTWNGFMNFLVADDVLPGNPMAAVYRPKPPKGVPKPLHGNETPAVLLSSVTRPRVNARNPWPQRDLAVLAVLLLAGLRSSELLSLTMASIAGRPGERRISVNGKGGKRRYIPIEDSLQTVIDDYLRTRRERLPDEHITGSSALFVDHRGNALKRGGLTYLVDTSLRSAGVGDRRSPGAMVHALRHTFATQLAENGASATEIKELLGHASLATSQIYIDSTAQQQRQSAATNPIYGALPHRE